MRVPFVAPEPRVLPARALIVSHETGEVVEIPVVEGTVVEVRNGGVSVGSFVLDSVRALVLTEAEGFEWTTLSA